MGEYMYNACTGEIRDSEDNELIVTVASSDVCAGERICSEMNRGAGRDDDEVGFFWHVDDVRERAEENDIELTSEQCREVLRLAKKNYDCNYGVSWETLDVYIDEVAE